MGSSPDVGGRFGLGRPQVPDVHEQQTSAHVHVAKQGLGIMPNTLEVPFTQLGDQAWKYKSPATKPLIPSKVLVAVVREDPKENSALEEKFYQECTEELPLDLNFNLKKENKKPPYQRDYRFLVLDQLLRFLSKALTHLAYCEKLRPEDYPENCNKVRARPFSALWEWLSIADNLIHSMQKLYGSLRQDVEHSSSLAHNLSLLKELKETVNKVLKNDDRLSELMALNKRLELLKERYSSKQDEHPLKIMENAVTTLAAITHAVTKGPKAHLLLAPNLIENCYLSNPVATGGIGKGIQAILKKMISSINGIDTTDALHSTHFAHLLLFLFQALVLQASGAPRLIAKEGKKALTGEKERMQSFAYKLASCLIATSYVLPTIGREAFTLTHLNPDAASNLVEGIDFLAMNIPIIAGWEGSELIKGADPLIGGMRLLLLERLNQMKSNFENNETGSTDIAIALRQAILSLQKEESLSYFEAIDTALNEVELNLGTLKKESEEVCTFVILLLGTINDIHSQDIITSVMSERA